MWASATANLSKLPSSLQPNGEEGTSGDGSADVGANPAEKRPADDRHGGFPEEQRFSDWRLAACGQRLSALKDSTLKALPWPSERAPCKCYSCLHMCCDMLRNDVSYSCVCCSRFFWRV